ncbi:hypothetical protein [Solwaraspora sp. WMMA2101]|uniref:hypothetical protein n=1 Tax=Solwaraspora sp. WMMA2101 TaxID=3404124 RepID=UPI003B9255DA
MVRSGSGPWPLVIVVAAVAAVGATVGAAQALAYRPIALAYHTARVGRRRSRTV